MGVTVGIRREDKSRWERRVPLVPADVTDLIAGGGLRFVVQPSPIRVFADDRYRAAGADVAEDLDVADIVLAVKEIPVALLQADKRYVYFAHVIKGQSYNMPMLAHLLEVGATLIDYERIADENGRRLIFFSLHAGYAGMIETLHAVGRRLAAGGRRTPLLQVRQAYEYDDLAAAQQHLRTVGQELARDGGVGLEHPLVIGVAGYGNVARGCQEILDCLPIAAATPAALLAGELPAAPVVTVTFAESDMVAPSAAGAAFALQEYYDHPDRYAADFERFLPHLDVLMNTIYWEERYPRLVTKAWVKRNYGPGRQPRLQVIGDISCDIEGSIEVTVKATEPDNPCFVYDPLTDQVVDGFAGEGPVVMAVDNLPCELPRESSEHFSSVLRRLVPELAACDWRADFDRLALPDHLRRAVIVHHGELTPDYIYLREYLDT